MAKAKKFDPHGEFAVQIVRYLIHKAKEAISEGVSASEGDFGWRTFVRDSEALANSIADQHPGGESDHPRLARVNYNKQATKFIKWLADGRGYPKAFAGKAGLVDCKLGGTEGDIAVGSDDGYSDHGTDDEEVPLADQRHGAAATPKTLARVTPGRSSAKKTRPLAFDLKDLTDALEEDDTMQVVTVVEENVSVKGFGGTRFHDVLLMQALLIGGAVVSTIKVEINRDDPNEGVVSVDQDPHVIVGSRRIKKEYRSGNQQLALKFEAKLDLVCKTKFAVDGTVPPHSKVHATFRWPEGLKSQLIPIDPYILGFWESPSTPGQTLFDTKAVKAKGKDNRVVSAMLLTAFYLVEKHTHVSNIAGSGLRCADGPSDSDSEGSMTPRNRSRGSGSFNRRTSPAGSSAHTPQKKRKTSPSASGVVAMDEEDDDHDSNDPFGLGLGQAAAGLKSPPTYARIPTGTSTTGSATTTKRASRK